MLIENQLERADHTHLGQLLTYAAGLNAVTIVWISAQFTEEHRAALDWLNEITDDRFTFFGLEVELWRIGESLAAPKFNVISKPNDWTRSVADAAKGIKEMATTETQRFQVEFWTGFREHMHASQSVVKATKPLPQSWMWMGIGRSGIGLCANVSTWSSEDKTYGTGEVRAELLLNDVNAKAYFHLLQAEREAIESEFGESLTWYSKDGVKNCRIYVRRDAKVLDRDLWPELFTWLREKLERLRRVFRDRVRALDPGDWHPEKPHEMAS